MHGRCLLAGLLGLFLGLARAESPPGAARRAIDSPVKVGNFDAGLLAREIFRLSNVIRTEHGLALFKPEPRLAVAAEGQAEMLAIRIHSGHDNPRTGLGNPSARVQEAGLSPGVVAENSATLNARDQDANRDYTYRVLAALIVQAWMDSPGHRANLLNPRLHYLGCGARVAFLLRDEPMVYAIQDFYTPMPQPDSPPAVRPGAAGLGR